MAEQNSFHHTLDKLKELQIVLNEKFDLEKKLVDLPRDVEMKEQLVFRMKENFLLADNQYQELKKSVTLKEDELNRLQSHRERYEKEIAQVSSQRDYEQLDRAIKENLEQEQIMRNDYNTLESKLNAFAEEYNNTETLLRSQEEDLETLKKEMENQFVEVKTHLNGIKNKEVVVTTDLDSKLVFKFERIIRSKGGDGIVAVKNNICNGCHMILPLQFVNEVCKEEQVLNCPYCSKILFYDADSEIEDLEQIDSTGLQDLFEDNDIALDDFDDEDYELFMEKDNIGSDSYSVPTEDTLASDDDEDDVVDDDDIEDDIDSDIEENEVEE